MATNSDGVGARLRHLRESLGLTQAEVAGRVGVTRQYIAKIENDPAAGGALSIDRLTQIATELGVTFAELVPACDVPGVDPAGAAA